MGLGVANLDGDVLDRLGRSDGADTGATILGEPVGSGRVSDALTPGGDNEGHAVSNVVLEVLDVGAAVGGHNLGAVFLSERGAEAEQVVIGVEILEGDLGVERFLGVDGVLRAGTVAVVVERFDDVQGALARAIASVVVTGGGSGIALMRSGGPGVQVGLLKVHLGAEVGLNVGITVEPVVVDRVQLAVPVLAGHRDSVEGVKAAALKSADVSIPLDGTTEEVRLVEVGGVDVPLGIVHDVTTVVHGADVV